MSIHNYGFNINDTFISYNFYEDDILSKFNKFPNIVIKFYWGYSNEPGLLNNFLKNIDYNKKYLIFFHNDYNEPFEKIPDNVCLYRTGLYKKIKKSNEFILPIYYNNNINYSLINFIDPVLRTDKPKICFSGSFRTHHERTYWCETLKKSDKLECNIIDKGVFRGGTTQELIDNYKTSEFCFCPRGTGNFSIRFYETLYYGRIPVLINTDVELPFNNKINWNEVCIIGDNIEELPNKIYIFWKNNDIIEIQKKCKQLYQTYFYGTNLADYIYEEVNIYYNNELTLYQNL